MYSRIIMALIFIHKEHSNKLIGQYTTILNDFAAAISVTAARFAGATHKFIQALNTLMKSDVIYDERYNYCSGWFL